MQFSPAVHSAEAVPAGGAATAARRWLSAGPSTAQGRPGPRARPRVRVSSLRALSLSGDTGNATPTPTARRGRESAPLRSTLEGRVDDFASCWPRGSPRGCGGARSRRGSGLQSQLEAGGELPARVRCSQARPGGLRPGRCVGACGPERRGGATPSEARCGGERQQVRDLTARRLAQPGVAQCSGIAGEI